MTFLGKFVMEKEKGESRKIKDKNKKLRSVATNRNEVEFGEAKSRFGGDKRQIAKCKTSKEKRETSNE